ncbi:MAG: biotin--[acetyl-CoA-carboxylase] ligase [Lewinellaceae bacterium]|nr:biotin--[acetyl-CoA-carboxylase] ligase [Saprospiraceae bacterium]MCB9338068.1 biotin--[acetyl-CoA-carboxylase] ligase [Lewinellaceae bacterium]
MQRFYTLFVGQVFHDLPQVDSTNSFALDLLTKSKPSEGTVISTLHQTNGRGQIGSSWESEPGKNISLSIILYPSFLPAHLQFQFSQAISLAVYDLVFSFFGEKARIKWPNDIYVGQKKVAGILIQNSIAGSHLRSSVAGIGINVNQESFKSNPPNPTSFFLENGKFYDLGGLIAPLLQFVEKRYLQLKSGKIVPLQHSYLEALYRFDEDALFQRANGDNFMGRISGVTASGRLIISVQHQEETFDHKEIRFCHS